MTTFTVRHIIADEQDIPGPVLGAVEDVIVYGAELVVLGGKTEEADSD